MRDALTLIIVVGVLATAYLLPPDTSLSQVQDSGVLQACVPRAYPPLVTGDARAPGIDVEILRAVSDELGVSLALNTVTAMGRDFNPRTWQVTRAQCQILAGGVIISPATRSFLENTPPHLSTGWALISEGNLPSTLEGRNVGFFAGATGLDRIALSRHLRNVGASVTVLGSSDALAEGLASDTFDVGVTEALVAQQIAGSRGWNVGWLPELQRYPIAFGLWKGDLTLKRALSSALDELERQGTIQDIARGYDVRPGTLACDACSTPVPRTAASEGGHVAESQGLREPMFHVQAPISGVVAPPW